MAVVIGIPQLTYMVNHYHSCSWIYTPRPGSRIVIVASYPVHTYTAGVKQCLRVCGVCVPKKILKNTSSRVTRVFTDVIVNEKQSA